MDAESADPPDLDVPIFDFEKQALKEVSIHQAGRSSNGWRQWQVDTGAGG